MVRAGILGVGRMMLGQIRGALQRRRAAIREAGALVWQFGARGVAMAESFAQDPLVGPERREHYRRIARHARRRQAYLESLDTGSRYEEMSRVSKARCHGLP